MGIVSFLIPAIFNKTKFQRNSKNYESDDESSITRTQHDSQKSARKRQRSYDGPCYYTGCPSIQMHTAYTVVFCICRPQPSVIPACQLIYIQHMFFLLTENEHQHHWAQGGHRLFSSSAIFYCCYVFNLLMSAAAASLSAAVCLLSAAVASLSLSPALNQIANICTCVIK